MKRWSKQQLRRRDLLIAPLCEAGLILVVALAAWFSREPLIFASLGPTAYELVETPDQRSARPYNIIVGHLIGIAMGFAALYVTRAWWTPAVSQGNVAWQRVAAAVLASAATVFFTLLARASQPAAIATTLLVALGFMQRKEDAAILIAAVLLLTALGEPLRAWRSRTNAEGMARESSDKS